MPTLVLHRAATRSSTSARPGSSPTGFPAPGCSCSTATTTSCPGDPDQILDAIEPFVATAAGRPEPALALAAVAAVAGGRQADVLVAGLVRAGRAAAAGPGRPGGRALRRPGHRGARRPRAPASRSARLGVAIAEVARDADQVDGHGVQVAVRLADAAPHAGSIVARLLSCRVVLLAGSAVVMRAVSSGVGLTAWSHADAGLLRGAVTGR